DDKFVRKLKSTASVIADALRQYLIAPFVARNFGADAPVPKVRFVFDEPEDVVALTNALKELVPLGLEVSQDEIREKLRLRAPGKDEAKLSFAGLPTTPAASEELTAKKPISTALFSSATEDEIDALIAE